ncbi:MAG: hypothetical protein WCC66_08480 [Rhizobiaceae bacterium]
MSSLKQLHDKVAKACSIMLLAAIAACTTTSGVEDTLSVAGSAEMPAPSSPGSASIAVNPVPVTEKPTPPRSGQPVNSGEYPNINIVPEGQTAQLSNDETAALKAQLSAEKDAQRLPGEPIEAYLARLRRLQQLGSTHAAAVLAEIEASQ